jgi:hypothetical protein
MSWQPRNTSDDYSPKTPHLEDFPDILISPSVEIKCSGGKGLALILGSSWSETASQ